MDDAKEVNPVERNRHLVLGRVAGQRVHVGDNVTVEVVQVRGGKVRLCFIAPPSVSILRGELRKAA